MIMYDYVGLSQILNNPITYNFLESLIILRFITNHYKLNRLNQWIFFKWVYSDYL